MVSLQRQHSYAAVPHQSWCPALGRGGGSRLCQHRCNQEVLFLWVWKVPTLCDVMWSGLDEWAWWKNNIQMNYWWNRRGTLTSVWKQNVYQLETDKQNTRYCIKDAAVETQKKTNIGVDKHLRSAAGVFPTDMISRDVSCKLNWAHTRLLLHTVITQLLHRKASLICLCWHLTVPQTETVLVVFRQPHSQSCFRLNPPGGGYLL